MRRTLQPLGGAHTNTQRTKGTKDLNTLEAEKVEQHICDITTRFPQPGLGQIKMGIKTTKMNKNNPASHPRMR